MRDFREDFRSAGVVHLAATAPKDGSPIVGRNRAGECELVRWRTGTDLDGDADEPYWARFDTDEEFEFIDWIPSPLTDDEFMRLL